ncbi:MAG TPA: hypothetical protein DD420_04585 [Streptomyces sp.]|nr:hypothetical protein [Streptomyces sp.]
MSPEGTRASETRGQVTAADRLAGALPEDFEELFATLLTEDSGAVAQTHQALETAAEWCRVHGVGGSAELDSLAARLADLGDELHHLSEDMGREIRSLRPVVATRPSPAVSSSRMTAGPPPTGRQLPSLRPPPPARCRTHGEEPHSTKDRS